MGVMSRAERLESRTAAAAAAAATARERLV